MKTPFSTPNPAAALIDSCSNLVAQLDKHQVGGAMFVCCLALLLVGVVVLALTMPLRAAQPPSHQETPKVRKKARRAQGAAGNGQKQRKKGSSAGN